MLRFILETYFCIKILFLNTKVYASFTTGVILAHANSVQDYTNWYKTFQMIKTICLTAYELTRQY